MSDDESLFLGLGLAKKSVTSLLKNKALTEALREVIQLAKVEKGCDKTIGRLLYDVAVCASKKEPRAANVRLLVPLVVSGAIDKIRIKAALALTFDTADGQLTQALLEKECGVGISYTADQVAAAARSALASFPKLTEERYRFPLGKLLQATRDQLPWGDGAAIKAAVDQARLDVLGPKTDEDNKKPAKKAKKKPVKGVKKGGQVGNNTSADGQEEVLFPKPEANLANNRPDILKRHLAATGGKVVTRFPPEPNGYLHIGHAKAMHLDFGYGKKMGKCILRFDDTNPEAESQEYIDSIQATVKWLGHEPAEVTYSSDYFEKLHELAVDLIKRGKAYVCHQTSEQTSEYRYARKNSPFRDRSIAENLKLFEEMRLGLWAEGEAWLRMKIDMQHDNTVMRDPCAYRVKFHHHPRTGDKYCIYPSYDFTHCIVDSLENVTHSLCTLEFDARRESYYWLLDALELYKPLVWEFSRLEFQDKLVLEDNKEWALVTTLSKRRLLKLVQTGVASGWDDPRMPTLDGLCRRGFTAASIEQLMEDIGVTRGIQRIPFRRLELTLRQDLEKLAPRRFGILNPLKLVVTNYDDIKLRECVLKNHPTDESMGTRKLAFTKVLYIDRNDFRLEDSKSYFGLAPNKEVGLRYAANFLCTEVKKADDGTVLEVHGTVDPERKNKTKGHIHWLPEPESGGSRRAEVRVYEWLFHSCKVVKAELDTKAQEEAARRGENHEESEDEETETHEPLTSATTIESALVESNIGYDAGKHFQFERVGYFVVDRDSDATKKHLVLNRACALKESKGKRELKK